MLPEDDSDDAAEYSSPACLLHEVDPAYRGYMTDAEVLALLEAAYARTRTWPAGADESTAVLEGHIRRLGGTPGSIAAADRDPALRVVELLQQALPRIADPALHADLKAMLAAWAQRD